MAAKKLFIPLLITLLLSTLVSINTTQASNTIIVESPSDGKTYQGSVRLKYTIQHSYPSDWVLDVRSTYYLDGREYGKRTGNLCEAVFTDLSNSEHTVTIHVEVQFHGIPIGPYWAALETISIKFFVNNGRPPSVSIIGLSNYKTNHAMLNITSSNPDATISYSLNKQAKTTLPTSNQVQYLGSYQYSLNLTDLPDGTYVLQVIASDAMGNIGEADKTFIIKASSANPTELQPSIEPTHQTQTSNTLPTIAFVSGGVITGTIIASVILLFYRKSKQCKTEKKLTITNK